MVGIACVRTLQSETNGGGGGLSHGARWSSRPKTASSHIASSHLPATRPFPAAVSHFQPRQLRRMITLQKSTRLLKAPSWLRGWASASTSRLRPRRSTSCLATWLWPRVSAADHDAAHTAPDAARTAPDQRRGALPDEQPRPGSAARGVCVRRSRRSETQVSEPLATSCGCSPRRTTKTSAYTRQIRATATGVLQSNLAPAAQRPGLTTPLAHYLRSHGKELVM